MTLIKWTFFTLGTVVLFCLGLFFFDLYFDYYINHTTHGWFIIKWPLRILIGAITIILFILFLVMPFALFKLAPDKKPAFLIIGLIISSFFINMLLGYPIRVTTSGLNESTLTILKSITCGLGLVTAAIGFNTSNGIKK